nr:ABC transporter substrate-binding protein [Pseudovibrio stylochi]
MRFSIQKVVVLLIVALGFSATAQAAEKITVGALRFTSHSPSFIAKERGYFADQGIEVEFKFFQAAQPMAMAIASGDVDFGITAITGGLISLAEKGAVKVVGGALQEEPGVDGMLILASKKAFEEGLVSPANLKGRSYGVTTIGSSFHYTAHNIADKEGFARSDIKIRPMQKVGAMIAGIKSGQLDAISMVPHIAKALAASSQVFVIGEVVDYIPDYQVTTVFTSPTVIREKSELVKKFLVAFSRGAHDFNQTLVEKKASAEEQEAMIKLIHKYVYADRPFKKAAPAIRNGAMRINENASLNLKSIEDQLNWFKSENLVSKDITIETLVDTQFVEMSHH